MEGLTLLAVVFGALAIIGLVSVAAGRALDRGHRERMRAMWATLDARIGAIEARERHNAPGLAVLGRLMADVMDLLRCGKGQPESLTVSAEEMRSLLEMQAPDGGRLLRVPVRVMGPDGEIAVTVGG